MAYSNEDSTLITVNVHWDADNDAIKVEDHTINGFITIDIGHLSLFIESQAQLDQLFEALTEANDYMETSRHNRYKV